MMEKDTLITSDDCKEAVLVEATLTTCNQEVLVQHINGLYGDRESSDLLISVNNTIQFHVHKVVMSRSPVFRSMLFGKGWQESGSGIILLSENELYVAFLNDFLKYLYGIPVQLTWLNVESLVYFGDKYVVDSLLDECLCFFHTNAEKNGHLLSALNAWKIGRRVLQHHKERLRTLQSVVFSNVELVLRDETLLRSLDVDDMQLILNSDDVVCRTEFTLYRMLELWLLMKEEDIRLQYFRRLLPLLRLSYMHVQELGYVENSPKRLFAEERSHGFTECMTLIKVSLCDAYKFHIIPYKERRLSQNYPASRLYLAAGTCLRYHLQNIDGLLSWEIMKKIIEIKGSSSIADTKNISFCVTLMRKMNASTLESAEKHKHLLSLDIQQMSESDIKFTCGFIHVNENRNNTVLRRPLATFEFVDGCIKADIKLEGINFDNVVKKSLYQYFDETYGQVYLGLDIFLF